MARSSAWLLLRRLDLHEHQLALDQVVGRELPHLDDRDELLHLADHLLHRLRVRRTTMVMREYSGRSVGPTVRLAML